MVQSHLCLCFQKKFQKQNLCLEHKGQAWADAEPGSAPSFWSWNLFPRGSSLESIPISCRQGWGRAERNTLFSLLVCLQRWPESGDFYAEGECVYSADTYVFEEQREDQVRVVANADACALQTPSVSDGPVCRGEERKEGEIDGAGERAQKRKPWHLHHIKIN